VSRSPRLRAPRRSRLLAGLVVGALAGLGASAAFATTPTTLRLGDEFTVKGTPVYCAVAAAAKGPTTIVCGLGSPSAPKKGAYAFGVADSAVLLLATSAAGKDELAGKGLQPTGKTLAVFEPTSRKTARVFSARSGALFVVGGTAVLCGVTIDGGTPGVTCGLAASAKSYVLDSEVALLTSHEVIISKYIGGTKFKTLDAVKQPS
jgi:hypothetical protein